MRRTIIEWGYASWESEIDKAMWTLELREKAARQYDFEFQPTRIMSGGTVYQLGWVNFKANGETVVEWLNLHVHAGKDPALFDAAWTFYVALSLDGRLRYKTMV